MPLSRRKKAVKKKRRKNKEDKTESMQSRIGIRGRALSGLHIKWIARKKIAMQAPACFLYT
jgi:hypothetical protein